MTERRRQIGSRQTDADIPASAAEMEMEARENEALAKIFLYLEESALLTGKHVKATTHEVPMTVNNGLVASEFVLIVNPAIVLDGHLSVIVLDLYHDELEGTSKSKAGKHALEWVAVAEWDGDQVANIITDLNVVEKNAPKLGLANVAEYVSGKFGTQLEIDRKARNARGSNTVVNAPLSYTRGIN